MQAESFVITKRSPIVAPGIAFAQGRHRQMALMPSLTRIAESLLAGVDRFAEAGSRQHTSREDKMNIRDIPKTEFAIKAGVHRHDHSHTGHAHIWQRAMSRRQFIRTAASAAGIGAALGAGVWRLRLARAD
jgi:hypothetical protein